MGQRLCLNVIYDGEEIANLYYHWSAYTISAYYEALKVLEYVNAHVDYDSPTAYEDICVSLFEFAYKNGGGLVGGLEGNEYREFIRKFPLSKIDWNGSRDRSEGLLCFTEEGMENSKGWAEGFCDVDLNEGRIYNGCISCWDIEETDQMVELMYYEKDENISEEELLSSLNVGNIDPCNCTAEEAVELMDKLDGIPQDQFVFRTDDTLYEMIA